MFGRGAPATAGLDMAITHADFVRQLTAAFGPPHNPEPDVFTGRHDGWAWRIALRPTAPTRLGSVVLERWAVRIDLAAPTPEARTRWWDRFTTHFQKGGG